MVNNPTPSACPNCNGKGFNSRCYDVVGSDDFGGEGYTKRGLIERVPCTKCQPTPDPVSLPDQKPTISRDDVERPLSLKDRIGMFLVAQIGLLVGLGIAYLASSNEFMRGGAFGIYAVLSSFALAASFHAPSPSHND